MNLRGAGGTFYRLHIDLPGRYAKGDVLGNAGVGQVDVLWHIAIAACQFRILLASMVIPSTLSVPACGCSRPSSRSMTVLLPAPLFPTMPTLVLAGMTRSKSCSTFLSGAVG